ncbi:GNAT family N-acetyltransferase [Ligilactobacillus acidipiscis]|uniref:GNAT family N-acetyltransferase n=1 Tax=Ligilactobacillus acidipiscis TaxID=89059 RepID=UPI0023F7240D|nr:GNAT family protein [Ligilactobacillus acidipiscis]WEV58165.1 GNAT family protein [Ligilactobacillus acidipiscis]
MMFNNWASDARVTKYLSWSPHNSLATTEKGLLKRQNNYVHNNYYDWGIVIKKSAELIGTITVVGQQPAIKSMKIGYCIGYNWWGNNYATEALQKIIFYLFNTTNVNRIEATHDARNAASGKVMQKSGMSYEGTLRQAGKNNLGLCDEKSYSILRKEYYQK